MGKTQGRRKQSGGTSGGDATSASKRRRTKASAADKVPNAPVEGSPAASTRSRTAVTDTQPAAVTTMDLADEEENSQAPTTTPEESQGECERETGVWGGGCEW